MSGNEWCNPCQSNSCAHAHEFGILRNTRDNLEAEVQRLRGLLDRCFQHITQTQLSFGDRALWAAIRAALEKGKPMYDGYDVNDCPSCNRSMRLYPSPFCTHSAHGKPLSPKPPPDDAELEMAREWIDSEGCHPCEVDAQSIAALLRSHAKAAREKALMDAAVAADNMVHRKGRLSDEGAVASAIAKDIRALLEKP